jgi:ABC-type transport system substrate-binding protein
MRTRANRWTTIGAGLLAVLATAGRAQAARPLVFALSSAQPVTTLDNLDAGSVSRLVVEAQIMEGLLGFDRKDDQLLEVRLAENYHRIDSRTYVFRLRHDIFFHPHYHGAEHEDAERVTAEDVAFSLLRAKRSPGAKESRFDNLESVRAVSPDLLKIKLIQPDDGLPSQLATAMGHVTCRKYFESLGADDLSRKAAFARHPIGTGPYRLANALSGKGVPIVLERFAGYRDRDWVKSPKAITRVEYRYFDNPAAIIEGLKSGEIGMADLRLSDFGVGGMLGSRRQPPFGGVAYLQPPYLGLIAINLAKPDLSDRRVRRLLNAAVRKAGIGDLLPPPRGDLPLGYTRYLDLANRYLKQPDDLETLRHDPQAQGLLKRLRARGALTILAAAGQDAVREEVITNLAKVLDTELDLKAEIRRSSQLTAEIDSAQPSYDLIYVDWTPNTPAERDGSAILRPLFSSASKENISRFKDPTVDRTFTELDSVIDKATAERLNRTIEDRLLDDPPHIWLPIVCSHVIVYAKGYRAHLGSSLLVYYSSFLKSVEWIRR